MTGKLNMSKRQRDQQFQKVLDALDRAQTDEEVHEAMAMLPEPPPEVQAQLDEHGDWIPKPASRGSSTTAPPTTSLRSTSTTRTGRTTGGSGGAST